MKDELEEAELILHDALRLAFKSDNKKAITYTYDLMANVAFIRGQLENAEKLFKATMSYLLGGGLQQEDNAIIEISLKLASIYAAQNRQELALAGYEFCISTLEEKIEREKELAEDILSAEEKANTHLLLGMCLDSCARYLLFSEQPSRAQGMYERAVRISEEILGDHHPQTVVLLSDLATTLDAQGRFDEAYACAQRAAELARRGEHPELHVLLRNLAAILTHREQYAQAKAVYQEALQRAERKRDEVSVQHIREELAELSRKRSPPPKRSPLWAPPWCGASLGTAIVPSRVLEAFVLKLPQLSLGGAGRPRGRTCFPRQPVALRGTGARGCLAARVERGSGRPAPSGWVRLRQAVPPEGLGQSACCPPFSDVSVPGRPEPPVSCQTVSYSFLSSVP
uniref:Tetratricopeptide repeat protein 19, mitochondrial n=1 Tax=Sus scrofa TaxID=9823 RepID=A0A4X1VBE3_PIG